MRWWSFALVLVLVSPATAERVDVVFPTLHGQYILTLDTAQLSESEIRNLIVLSPHLSGWTSRAVVPRLELCVADDPTYVDCDARDPTVPAFFSNARANVRKAVQTIAALDGLRYPGELDAVVAYLKRSLALSLWLEQTRLAYYESWDDAVLARPYGGVEPARECERALRAVTAAASREDKHHRAAYDWHNCVNSAVRRELGAYPAPAWEAFLIAYGIRERLVESDADTRRLTR
jgi:hypothetical protein